MHRCQQLGGLAVEGGGNAFGLIFEHSVQAVEHRVGVTESPVGDFKG
jgi:hypothetical protein